MLVGSLANLFPISLAGPDEHAAFPFQGGGVLKSAFLKADCTRALTASVLASELDEPSGNALCTATFPAVNGLGVARFHDCALEQGDYFLVLNDASASPSNQSIVYYALGNGTQAHYFDGAAWNTIESSASTLTLSWAAAASPAPQPTPGLAEIGADESLYMEIDDYIRNQTNAAPAFNASIKNATNQTALNRTPSNQAESNQTSANQSIAPSKAGTAFDQESFLARLPDGTVTRAKGTPFLREFFSSPEYKTERLGPLVLSSKRTVQCAIQSDCAPEFVLYNEGDDDLEFPLEYAASYSLPASGEEISVASAWAEVEDRVPVTLEGGNAGHANRTRLDYSFAKAGVLRVPAHGSTVFRLSFRIPDYSRGEFNLTLSTPFGPLEYDPTLISGCGAIASSDYYVLKFDISGNGNCLDIRANDVTIDCDGKSISGNGTGYGIYVDRHYNVSVLNCEIKNFSTAVYYYGDVTDDCTLTDNTVWNNTGDGFYLEDGDHNLYAANNASYNGDSGFKFRGSAGGNTVKSSTASHNANGLTLNSDTADDQIVYKSEFSFNTAFGITATDGDYNNYSYSNISYNGDDGIYLAGSSTNNNVSSNNITGNSAYGIYLYSDDTDLNTINRNTAYANTDYNIRLNNGDSNVLRGNNASYVTSANYYLSGSASSNEVLENLALGGGLGVWINNDDADNNLVYGNKFYLASSYGMQLADGDYNNFSYNNASHNGEHGFYIYGSATFNNISSNNITYNSHGIYINSGTADSNTIDHNTLSFNPGNGIFITSASYTDIAYNNASYNTNYGLFFYNGASNTARGNHFSYNAHSGLTVAYEASSGIVGFNNTLVGNSRYGIYHIDGDDCNYSYNNVSSNGRNGIILLESYGDATDNDILYNEVHYNGGSSYSAVFVSEENVDSNTFAYNTVTYNNLAGFESADGDSNNYSYNNVSYNARYGFQLRGSSTLNNVSWNNVTGNSVGSNSYDAIYFYDEGSDYNTVDHNTVNLNNRRGISISDGDYNAIYSNNASNNSYSGVHLTADANNNTISDNEIKWNGYSYVNYDGGVYLSAYVENNLVTGNDILYNLRGVHVDYADYNNVSYNNISYNTRSGVRFDRGAEQNNVSFNNLTGNSEGDSAYSSFYLDDEECDYNTIDYNTVFADASGLAMLSGSDSNVFTHNNLTSIVWNAVKVGANSQNNTYSHNWIYEGGSAVAAIYLYGTGHESETVYNNSILSSGYALYFDSPDFVNVSYNNASYNRRHGAYLKGTATNNEFSFNHFIGNAVSGSFDGIQLDSDDADSNTFYNNTVLRSSQLGVNLLGGDSNSFYNNSITGDACVNLSATANANSFYHNYLYGGATYFVNNADASNQFNTTVGDAAQGNYYADILDWEIYDSDADGFGDTGSDYPYDADMTYWLGEGADYGPITNKPIAAAANVTLLSPPDGSWNDSEITFAFLPLAYSSNFTNCTTEAWYSNGTLLNETNWNSTAITNDSNNFLDFSFPSNGSFYWNVGCWVGTAFNDSIANWTVRVDTAGPNFTFNYQDPADVSTLDPISIPLNISYNITDAYPEEGRGVDESTAALYCMVNRSESPNAPWIFVNGTDFGGLWQRCDFTRGNSSANYSFLAVDNEVLPATYNYNETVIEGTVHDYVELEKKKDFLRVELQNVSAYEQYGWFEVMANLSTSTSRTINIWYCNSSCNGEVNSTCCTNFYNIPDGNSFNHTHSINSPHHVAPFPVDIATGKIGDVVVTNTSYFLIQGRSGTPRVRVYYVDVFSRTGAIATTGDEGATWTNQTYTVDSHLHQFGSNDNLTYKAYACDYLGNCNYSDSRYDTYELGGIPPSSPFVWSPVEGTYPRGGAISVNYTASQSANSYEIAYYNVSLVYAVNETVERFILNNSLNLGYDWVLPDILGEYEFKVTGCDVNGLCSSGYSDNFTISGDVCRSLSSNFTLTGNVDATGYTNCFNASAHGLQLDCAGYSVYGAFNGYGFNNTGYRGVNVTNCTFVNFTTGVYYSGDTADAGLAYANIVYNSSEYGFHLEDGDSNNASYNNVSYSIQHGFVLTGSATGNSLFWNTLLGNSAGSTSYSGVILSGDGAQENSVYKNSILQGGYGIRLLDADHNNASYNNVSYNGNHGLFISGSATYNNVSWNNVTGNAEKGAYIIGATTGNNTFDHNTVDSSGDDGLLVHSASYNVIEYNRFDDNVGYNLFLYNTASNNVIQKNEFVNGDSYGVFLQNEDVDNNLIYDNEICSNGAYGLRIATGDYNNVSYNNISYNANDGIRLDSGANYNNVSSNNITGQTGNDGIEVSTSSSSYNTLDHNTISDNDVGIRLDAVNGTDARENSVTESTSYGIYLDNAFLNNASYNLVSDNSGHGIYLYDSSTNNNISWNNVTGNAQSGIAVYHADSDYNTIDHNTVFDTGSTIYDAGILLYSGDYNNVSYNNVSYGWWGIANSGTAGVGSAFTYNNISHNFIQENAQYGLFIYSTGAQNNTIYDNTAYRNGADGTDDWNIVLTYADYTNISYNNVSYGYGNGIGLWITAVDNIVQGNEVHDNADSGVYTTQDSCDSNAIYDNLLRDNANYGLYLNNGDEWNVSYNNASYNGLHGFNVLGSSTGSNYSWNFATGNEQNGFNLQSDTADGNTFDHNAAYANVYRGVRVNLADSNNFSYNNFSYNDLDGLAFDVTADSNYLFDNELTGNSRYGLWVHDSSYNNASYNLIQRTVQNGVYFTGGAALNNVSWNNITGNSAGTTTYYGLYLNSNDADRNTFDFNTVDSNEGTGIYLLDGDYNNASYNNASYNGAAGIGLGGDGHSTVQSNALEHNSDYGIKFLAAGYYDEVFDNRGFDNAAGIYLEHNSDFNNVSYNNFSYEAGAGLYVYGSCNNNSFIGNELFHDANGLYMNGKFAIYNEFYYNTAAFNGDSGVRIAISNGNNYSYNNLSYNTNYGLFSANDANDADVVYSNDLIGNDKSGAYLLAGDYNNFSYNNASYNTQNGILLGDSATNNNISWNNVTGNSVGSANYDGINLNSVDADYNTFDNNSVSGNGRSGFYLAGGDYNEFYNNTVNESSCFNATADSSYNSFYHNYLYGGSNSFVGNANETNDFNTTVGGIAQGNYYEDVLDWAIYDSDADGFGDTGYDYPYDSAQTYWFGEGADYGPINAAGEVSCRTLEGNLTLFNSVTAAGDCFTIGAHNIYLDCAGYLITGDETGEGVNNTGYDNVTVKNCFIQNFSRAVYWSADYGNLENDTLYDNADYGAEFYSALNNSLWNSNASYNKPNVVFNSSKYNEVYNSTIGHGAYGLLYEGASEAFILNTTFNYANFTGADCNQSVAWLIDFYSVNSTGEPVASAELNLSTNTWWAPVWSGTTNATGGSGGWLNITSYYEDAGGVTNYSNHLMRAFKNDYLSRQAQVDTSAYGAKQVLLSDAFTRAYGDSTYNVTLADAGGDAVFNWSAVRAHAFAYDYDFAVNWSGLQALGRNATGDAAHDDFAEADAALGLTGYLDSLSNSYGLETQAFTLYGYYLENVPVANSSNSSSLLTGILWDASNGGEYDGSQDLVFVAPVSASAQGLSGVVDYELSFPANLSNCSGAANQVSLELRVS